MSDKKKFKDTTVGKMLFGAAGLINPTLGSVLQGVTSPKEAIAEIGKSKISNDDKTVSYTHLTLPTILRV